MARKKDTEYYLLFYKNERIGSDEYQDAQEYANIKCAKCNEIYEYGVEIPVFQGKGKPYLEFIRGKYHVEHMKTCRGTFKNTSVDSING